jgi:hypothetical protein
VVEELARDGEEGEVVVPRVRKEFDSSLVDLKSERLQEGYEYVDELLVVKVEFERDELVQEGVTEDVV